MTLPYRHRSRSAFTLVELLVVIGIIAILISILLPVISRAQDQARSAACKSNLRQIYVATQTYANANKGSLPFGFYFARMDGQGNPVVPSAAPWVSWYTVLNSSMNPKAAPDVTNGFPNGGLSLMAYRLSNVFRCPGAPDFTQQVHYYQHGVAMPHLPLELKNPFRRPGAAGVKESKITAPARFTDLYNDNMLFWDTPLLEGVDRRTGLPFFQPVGSNEVGSALNVLPVTYVDKAQLRTPDVPEYRFRDEGTDLFSAWSDNSLRRTGQSIYFATDEAAQTLTASSSAKLRSFNVDMGGTVLISQLVGSVRFRHQRNTVANVAFADGSVQAMTLNKNRTISTAEFASYETTIQRRMLMIRWPTGWEPSGRYASPE